MLIENVLATFEMEEILYELREHSAGLNCGIWDYSASFVNKFGQCSVCMVLSAIAAGLMNNAVAISDKVPPSTRQLIYLFKRAICIYKFLSYLFLVWL